MTSELLFESLFTLAQRIELMVDIRRHMNWGEPEYNKLSDSIWNALTTLEERTARIVPSGD